jgi:tRNA A37 threonylcarbamoyladenosine synthetase subunit TsaC/SUA5/YrdC
VVGKVESLRQLFQERVDLFLEAGDLEMRLPSTVVDVGEGEPRVVRSGDQTETIEEALRLYGEWR